MNKDHKKVRPVEDYMRLQNNEPSYISTNSNSLGFMRMEISTSLDKDSQTKGKMSFLESPKMNKLISYCKSLSKYIFSYFLFVAWIVLYICSLCGCSKSQAECLKEVSQDTAVIVGILLYFSSFSFVILTIFVY